MRLALGLAWAGVALSGLAGCVPVSAYRLESLPLPAQTDNCCWQALQQLRFTRDGQSHRLQAVFARAPGQTHLVLLDPLGRRLATLRQTGEALEVTLAPEAPADLPATIIYKLAALAWLPPRDLERLRTGPWTVEETGLERVLRYRDRALVTVRYQNPDAPSAGIEDFTYDTRRDGEPGHGSALLVYPRAKLEVDARTLTWEAL